MDIIKFSYEDIEQFIIKSYKKILKEGFVPDYLLGISVGGFFPTIHFARLFQNQNVASIALKSYSGKSRKEIKLINLPQKHILKNKKVLIIDDICDSGETFKYIIKILKEKYFVKDIKTVAILVNKKNCKFYPDIYSKKVDKWVDFPWDKFEK